jgi:hypothetical protein
VVDMAARVYIAQALAPGIALLLFVGGIIWFLRH